MTGRERRIMEEDKITISIDFYAGHVTNISIPKEAHQLSYEEKTEILYLLSTRLYGNSNS